MEEVIRGREKVDFDFHFRSNSSSYRLRVPVQLPFTKDPRELALRLIKAHNLPCYLEDDLVSQLAAFVERVSVEVWDHEAEEKMYGGSVFEKGSETDQTIQQWVDSFTENHAQFSSLQDSTDSEVAFSEVYHNLIHSPALETLLQIEHTYAMAVSEECKAWENARELIQKRHDQELSESMQALGTTKSEYDINILMRKHTTERESCEARWSSELTQLHETQKREYREWVTKLHEDISNSEGKGGALIPEKPKKHKVSLPGYTPEEFSDHGKAPLLEESFTIHLGAQKKLMHNMRLLSGDVLDFCRHRPMQLRGRVVPQPERLQTSMSLYSPKLSAVVVMVGNRVNSLGGMKEAFAKVCHESTDFHFSDVDVQLSRVQGCALEANQHRMFARSLSSQISRSESASDMQERVSLLSSNDAQSISSTQLLSPPPSQFGLGGSSSSSRRESNDPSPRRSPESLTPQASPLLETTSVSLEAGDFYITRHSNLSQVHVVLHLVTDESAVMSASLKSRNPVMLGLKNCLRMAARNDIHHITIPLLLAHHMQPEMTINWCLKRAELVFKCVKGFMLENTFWGESGSRTVQFLIPPGVSEEVFEEFCEMLPKVFRIATTRNLTKTRAYSFK